MISAAESQDEVLLTDEQLELIIHLHIFQIMEIKQAILDAKPEDRTAFIVQLLSPVEPNNEKEGVS